MNPAPSIATSRSRRLARIAIALARVAVGVSAGGLVGACASGAGAAPSHAASTRDAIIAGTASDASQDAVVLLTYDPFGPDGFACSGTLVAPNLVLTARHCVSATLDGDIRCTGTTIGDDYTPAKFNVVVGSRRPSDASFADAHGARIFHDAATNLCAHDLALVLLDRDIPGAKVAPVRLDAPIGAGETFTAVGWGATQTSATPDLRQQRKGLRIDTVGPSDATAFGSIDADEFVVGESICEGDSGGPALATGTGAVLGVVSRGGNGQAPDPQNPSTECVGATNLYSTVAGFRETVLEAFAASGHAPWLEGGADPRLAPFAGTCASNDDCQSSLCDLGAGSSGTCTIDCTQAPCGPGYDCREAGAARVCVARSSAAGTNGATTTAKVGCSAARGPSCAHAEWIGIGALGLVALERRRRGGRHGAR